MTGSSGSMRAHNSSGTIHGGCSPFLTGVLNHHTPTGIPTNHSVSGSKSVRDMIEALIAGERSPRALADLARGRMRAKRAALIEALTGRFDQHHAELAQMLLDQIDALSAQIGTLTSRIEELTGAIPAARGVNADG